MKKLLITLLCILCLTACNKKEEAEKAEKEEITEQTTIVETTAFDIVDYSVYSSENLTNRFAIVKVRIKDEKNISYKLSDVVTSENIKLSDYKNYTDELDKNGVVLSNYNISTKDLKSDKTSAIFNLYCPIIDKTLKTLTLTFINEYKAEIDLTKNNITITADSNSEEKVITSETYQITVKNVYSTLGEALYENGEVSYYAGSSEIYAIVIKMVSLNGEKVTISDAEYVTSDNNSFTAMDSKYSTESAKNILTKEVKDNDEGCLLFETTNPQNEPITYKGILRLKINDKWYNVDVDL